jgi:GT2 family glycosyltransferase
LLTELPSVAIVILNWNGKTYLEQFLPSVLATQYEVFKVIVADNASTDDSIVFLKEHYPQVEILLLEKNFGFAKGYNEALKKIKAEYFVLLNSDVELTPGWLQPIISFMQARPSVAACQPAILSWHEKDRFEYAGAAGGWIDSFGYPFSRGRIFEDCEKDHGQYNDDLKIFWASGAALVIRSGLFNKAGGFDEYFFAHMEEIDLCWRLQLMGYELYCIPASKVYHVGGGTLPKGNSRKTFLNFRNNQVMLAKNLPWSEKWWKIPFRLILDQAAALKGLLAADPGYFFAVAKAHLAFFYWIFFVRSAHNPVKTVPLNSLEGVFKGNLAWEYFYKKRRSFDEIIKVKEKKRISF